MLALALIFFIGSFSCLCSLEVPSVRVLSPSEFDVVLPQDETGRLTDIRINVNKQLGAGEPDYKKGNLDGRVIHFSDGSLKLKRGDVIYYSMLFDDADQGIHGQDGNYIFNGVYKRKDRRRREVYEQSSDESSSSEGDSKEKDSDPKQGRYFHHGRPRGHFGPHHGPPHHHHGPHHFFPPPFGAPHYPPSFGGPGPWKGRGHDHRDKFGNHGPWEGHHDEDCDSFEHKPKYPGDGHRPDHRGPWRDDDPYSTNGDKNEGKNGFGRPFSERPSAGSDEKNNKPTEDPNVEIFTSRRPSSTTAGTTTTPVPNIDIRYRVPEDS